MATKQAAGHNQFGNLKSCYGACGIDFKHFVMHPR